MSKKIKLVLSGSGTLYPVHVGGIMRLMEAGYEIEAVAGSSGGALIAAGLGSGYKANEELIKLMKLTLPGINGAIKPSLLSFIFKWGFIKTKELEKLIDKYMANYLGQCVIPTYIVTANIETKEAKIWNSIDHPKMRLSKAIATSISIPFVFEPHEIDDQIYVDGGVANAFPLDIFGTGEDVIGLRIRSIASKKNNEIRNIIDYGMALIDTMIEASTRERIEDAIYARTIFLDTKGDSLNFNMTASQVDAMISEGYQSVDKWLKRIKD